MDATESGTTFLGESRVGDAFATEKTAPSEWRRRSRSSYDEVRRRYLRELRYDYILIGGGLQSGLLVLALRHHQPTARIAILERGGALGGEHTWSFHAGDVPEGARSWFAPLSQWQWAGYDVLFPGLQRTLNDPYASFTGTHLDRVVRDVLAGAPGCDVLVGEEVIGIEEEAVTLAGGRTIRGRMVVDARGPERGSVPARTGYQKFVGLEVRLREPHGLVRPVLMDATVPQIDGFHFMYALPFGPDRILLEDTYFSDDARLEDVALRGRIRAWAAARGLEIVEVIREERGVLPMPCEPVRVHATLPLVAGYAGGWFNQATGYSLPAAIRLADMVARCEGRAALAAAVGALGAEIARQGRFLAFLNRLLFEATAPEARRNVFERFYRLPPDCILRLYSMQLRRTDHLRILCGAPPPAASSSAAPSRSFARTCCRRSGRAPGELSRARSSREGRCSDAVDQPWKCAALAPGAPARRPRVASAARGPGRGGSAGSLGARAARAAARLPRP